MRRQSESLSKDAESESQYALNATSGCPSEARTGASVGAKSILARSLYNLRKGRYYPRP